jgi:hypothetical protein
MQKIIKYGNHKESNERTKIDQKTLIKRRNNTPSPHLFSIDLIKKKRDKNCSITTFILSQ